MNLFTKSTADFSDCGRYRWSLTRTWSAEPPVTWIMLNPSTADEHQDDPTIRRCVDFARRWGYGGVVIANIFALRSTDPKALKPHYGGMSDAAQVSLWQREAEAILQACRHGGIVVGAWGKDGSLFGRSAVVRQLMWTANVDVQCLDRTKTGEPRHPLYLGGHLRPYLLPAA